MSKLTAVLVLLVASCGSSQAPPAAEPTPVVVAPPRAEPALAVPASEPAPPGSAPPPPSAPAPLATSEAGPCRGRSFDLAALPDACGRGDAAPLDARLTTRLVPAASPIPSGGKVDVAVELVNPSTEEIEVRIVPSCVFFDLEVHDARGKRADVIGEACGYGGGCGGPARRIVLEPGGVVRKTVVLEATRTKHTKGRGCDGEPAGGIPPGTYKLVALGGFDFGSMQTIELPIAIGKRR